MNELIALPVPWMISPSAPDLEVTSHENGDTIVLASIALPAERKPPSVLAGAVRITLAAGLWVRVAPTLLDSDIPERFRKMEIDRSIFKAQWISSGICPDPGIYRVENSAWLAEEKLAVGKWKHFLIHGHDSWAEILAVDCTWEFVEENTGEVAF